MDRVKKHIKFIVGIMIGMFIPGIVYAATIMYASNEVSYDNSVSGLQAVNVQEALDELYSLCLPESEGRSGKAAPVTGSSKRLKVGDYFTMKADKDNFGIDVNITGYSSDQTIKPSELSLWRVIKVNDNGTVEAISEYVSSDEVYFKGILGYANFVGGLQTIAKEYKKDGYTSSIRIMGYDKQSLKIEDRSSFDGSKSSEMFESKDPTSGNGEEYSDGVDGDTLYLKDYLLVSELYKEDNNKDNYCESGVCAYKVNTEKKVKYWLSSRARAKSSEKNYSYYTGRSINDDGELVREDLFRGYSLTNDNWSDYSSSSYLRPIVTLYSKVKIASGLGTKGKPYTLSN